MDTLIGYTLSLVQKYQARVKVTNIDKHISLLYRSIIQDGITTLRITALRLMTISIVKLSITVKGSSRYNMGPGKTTYTFSITFC